MIGSFRGSGSQHGRRPALEQRLRRFFASVHGTRRRRTGYRTGSAIGRRPALSVGTAEGAVLRLTDPTVSRYHVDFEATTQGVVVRDLGSTNRTLLNEVSIREIAVTRDVELEVGRSRIRVKFDVERATVGGTAQLRVRDRSSASRPR